MRRPIMSRTALSVALLLLLPAFAPAQKAEDRRDRGVFVAPKNEFADSINRENEVFRKKPEKPKKRFQLDFSTVSAPGSAADFTQVWHFPPISQGSSGMCWCFATTSYFESEIYRLSKRQIKLSELYTVYWEYVEKARRFVRERGKSAFGEGSEANAVTRIWKMYGIVPAAAFTGLKPGQKFHDHTAMVKEMREYLLSLKSSNAWNEEEVLSTIRSILNHYIGEPPAKVTVDGNTLTPREYLAKIVRLNLDDYINIMSLMEKPYYGWGEYEVPDNWWKDSSYFNLPLDEYVAVVKQAITGGYSVGIGGDVSEPGYEGHAGAGIVPTFDIPSAYIDENARQFRFSNETSTDDHFIHLVGSTAKNGRTWFLIKDSASGSRNNTHPGYYFYDEDYVKLKILCLLVHRDALGEIQKKLPR
jgi:bleomycin hydrolase